MLKKFAITMICIASLLYGTTFLISRSNNTNFFEEINCQLMRLQGKFHYSKQVDHSKKILATVLNNEIPPSLWQSLLEERLHEYSDKAFYFFKIWLIEAQLTESDIDAAYPIFIATGGDAINMKLRFPGTDHVLQFNIYDNDKEQVVSGLIFPVNNNNFSADYNNDESIDYQDALLARKRRQ